MSLGPSPDPTRVYDAIVVGTGMSGGWAMMSLCEAGLDTLALERGAPVEHRTGYVTEHKRPWELPSRGRVPPEVSARDYPIQRQTYAFSGATRHYFVNDREHPYVQAKPYTLIQANVVGGRTLLWARQAYRWSPMDFTANLDDGHGVDWPIRYKDLAPWYEQVERRIGVSGQAEGLAQLPDSVFQPPMAMNVIERQAKARIEARFPERCLTIGRTATLTEPLHGRAACHYCGPCERGCSTGSYYSTQSVALPAARATGRLALRTHSLVHSVIYDEASGRATGVRVIDTQTREALEFRARLVFLCASAMNTVRVMLMSKSRRFPDGIANGSGTLGHYLLDHHYQVGAEAVFETHRDRYYRGNRPNGVYVPRFRNISPQTRRTDFLRGYGMQGMARRHGALHRGASQPGFGADFKHALRDPGPWSMGFLGFGETLPRYENHCALDPLVTDPFGLPVLRFDVTRDDNTWAMRADMAATAAEMLEVAGGVDVQTYDRASAPPGLGNHEMGGARMGRDPETSVLNAHNHCHEVPNLYVTDGACMTSSAWQNPGLTYLALTARACAHAVKTLEP